MEPLSFFSRKMYRSYSFIYIFSLKQMYHSSNPHLFLIHYYSWKMYHLSLIIFNMHLFFEDVPFIKHSLFSYQYFLLRRCTILQAPIFFSGRCTILILCFFSARCTVCQSPIIFISIFSFLQMYHSSNHHFFYMKIYSLSNTIFFISVFFSLPITICQTPMFL